MHNVKQQNSNSVENDDFILYDMLACTEPGSW